MSLDSQFVSKVLDVGITALNESGIVPEMLFGDGVKALYFVIDFFTEHGKLPDAVTVDRAFGEGFIEPVPEPFSYYADMVKERYATSIMGTGMQDAANALGSNGTEDALAKLKRLILDVEVFKKHKSDTISATGGAMLRWDHYVAQKNRGTLPGYVLPWPTLNMLSLGVNKGELWVLVGRLKSGKTFSLVYLCSWFFRNGLRVLFVTLEMTTKRVGQRFDAIHAKVPYGRLLRGTLTPDEETVYHDTLNELASASNSLYFMGRNTVQRTADLDMMITEFKPDIVIVDAIYRLMPNNVTGRMSKWERTAAVIDECQDLAIRKNVPIIVSTQFNRKQKKDAAKGETENIGLAWEIPQNADMVLGLLQSNDMRIQNRMMISVMEGRDVPRLVDIMIHWDLELMNFDEMGTVENGTIVPTQGATIAPATQTAQTTLDTQVTP